MLPVCIEFVIGFLIIRNICILNRILDNNDAEAFNLLDELFFFLLIQSLVVFLQSLLFFRIQNFQKIINELHLFVKIVHLLHHANNRTTKLVC